MQVTNSATIVDYFPEAFIAEGHPIKGMIVTIKRFNKRVTFRANGMKSYSTIVATDARNEWESRIAKGATVTDFNTDKMPSSEYMPLMCWFMSLIKHYLHSIMSQTNDNIIDRDQLQEAYIESIIDGMDHKTMYQFVYDSLNGNLDDYTVEELITEVEDYYPELIKDCSISNVTYSDNLQESS